MPASYYHLCAVKTSQCADRLSQQLLAETPLSETRHSEALAWKKLAGGDRSAAAALSPETRSSVDRLAAMLSKLR